MRSMFEQRQLIVERIVKQNKFIVLIIALVSWGGSAAVNADDDSTKEMRARDMATTVCGYCHGRDGNSISPQFPKLAGQTRKYLENQINIFRSQGRLNEEARNHMWGMARNLDDEMIQFIANYFSKQKPSPGGAIENAVLAEHGKQIFETKPKSKETDSCSNCHGHDAEGGGKVPRLAGQHRHYLERQINAERARERKVPDEMHIAVSTLSAADIEAVVEYLQAK